MNKDLISTKQDKKNGKFIIKKKILIAIISILIVMIMAIIISLTINFSNEKTISNREIIPKQYQGTWLIHNYYISDSGEMNSTYTLEITKNEITSDATDRILKYEINGDDFIIVYVNPETNEEFKEYLLLDNEQLYISTDRKMDNLDDVYSKKDSNAEKEAILQAKADYYAYNISKIATQTLKDTYKCDFNIYYSQSKELTEEQQSKKDNLNYYYAFYDSLECSLEISVNKSTGKLESAKYSENVSIYNDSNKCVYKNMAVLNAISRLIYADKESYDNINNISDEQKHTLSLYSNIVVSKIVDEKLEKKESLVNYEDKIISVMLSELMGHSITCYVNAK